ncbi:hypothetical protein BDW75DRAFT_232632 [Aspergillus navahoensis]
MAPVRRVVNAQWVTEFLQYILDHDRFSVLIVCAARETFLEQLLAAVYLHSAVPGNHEMLSKTLGLLSTSRNVRTVFCPTLEHLRAYLSTGMDAQLLAIDRSEKPRPFLAILNPLALHRSAREFSAQGLSRTFASAVEVSSRANMDLLLCECRDARDLNNTETGESEITGPGGWCPSIESCCDGFGSLNEGMRQLYHDFIKMELQMSKNARKKCEKNIRVSSTCP